MRFRLVRAGALTSYRWSGRPALAYGLGLETGVVLGGSGRGDSAFGLEVAPELFLEVPMVQGGMRPYLTLALGFRAGFMDDTYPLSAYQTTNESWFYFMPVIRVGFGIGR